MRRSACAVTLGLALGPLAVTACHAGPGGTQLDCVLAPGVDAGSAQALCHAVRAQASDTQVSDPQAPDPQALRLQVLSTGTNALSARLDRVTDGDDRPGRPLDFTVMDRDLAADDFTTFARDLLQFGLAD